MKFDDYQKKALTTALPSALNLPYVALGLTSEAGELAGKIKKWIRDNDSDPTKLDKEAIVHELGDTLWYLAVMSELLGVSLDDVARQNADKLASRKKRSVIIGSGDTR